MNNHFKVVYEDVVYQVQFFEEVGQPFLPKTEADNTGVQPITICVIRVGTNAEVTGVAFCNPKDLPSIEVGRKIALGKALKDLTDDIKLRAVFWEMLLPGKAVTKKKKDNRKVIASVKISLYNFGFAVREKLSDAAQKQ